MSQINKNLNPNRFYVYALLDTRYPGNYTYGEFFFKFKPFYVGKGQLHRWKRHFNESEIAKDKNTFKVKIIRKVQLETGRNPEVIFLKRELTDSDALILEKLAISTIGRRDKNLGPLSNLTDGGDGLSGNKRSEECKEKMRIGKMGAKNPMFGKKWNENQREAQKTAKKPQWSAESLEKNRNRNIKYEYTIISPTGESYHNVRSMREFCIAHNLSDSKMNKVSRGLRKHHKGWIAFRCDNANLRSKFIAHDGKIMFSIGADYEWPII